MTTPVRTPWLRAALRAFEGAPLGMAVVDLEGRYRACNEAFRALVGRDDAGLLGAEVASITHPDDVAREAEGAAALRAGAVARYEGEKRYLHGAGHWVWAHLSATLVRDPAGGPLFFTHCARDVARERAEAEARDRAEALYRAIAHHLPGGVAIVFDHDLRYLHVDGAGVGAFAREPSWYAGKTLYEVMPAPVAAPLEPHYRAALAGREVRFSTKRYGRVYESRAVPVRDAAGAIFCGLIVSHDVTEQSHEDRSRLAAIIASSGDAIFTCTAAGLVDTWNPGAERLYGLHESEALGRPVEDLAAPGHEAELRELVRKGLAGERTSNREAVHLGRGGALLDVALTVSPLVGGLGVAIIARDVGASKEAERKLKASLREKDVLLREVHHRVKNKLQLISSMLNLQARRATEPAVRAALHENRERIYAVALLHETLYGDRSLADLDLGT
ncbi:MAG TPA: PAS domain-containing protein, partial [Polyangiaceae bacterium]|nr:PAS domain-containing protein [Polyangiaceae bacterium]